MTKVTKKALDAYLHSGIAFIEKYQDREGGFSGHILDFQSVDGGACADFFPMFVSLLISSCCSSVPKNEVRDKMREKLQAFILRNRNNEWMWNYWPIGSKARNSMPYPDDMDDTACALIALRQYDENAVDGEVMAYVVNALSMLEVAEGGPYRTWLVGEGFDDIWMDVDLVVNSNIAYLLSFFDIELPEITAFIEKKIDAGSYESPYYVPPFSIIYFISRWYKGEKKKLVIDYILNLRQSDGSFGNASDTALAISALLNFGYDPQGVVPSISFLIRAEGDWQAEPLYYDMSDTGRKVSVGSPALTAAFCIEAVAKYQKHSDKRAVSVKSKKKIKKQESDVVYGRIVSSVEKNIMSWGDDISRAGMMFLGKVLSGDTNRQITMLPYLFKQSLGKKADGINEEMLISLGCANLYGWMAYTIYDDFLDNEGDITLLPLANVCLRQLTLIFSSVVPRESEFSTIFQEVMNGIDAANAWEVRHCRGEIDGDSFVLPPVLPDFGDYLQLANRSFGHALGPLALLSMLGYTSDSDIMKHTEEFFRYFIIARQLNDDAHDWEEDLKNGMINAIGVDILREWGNRNDSRRAVSLMRDMPELQKICWDEVMPNACMKILTCVDNAEQALICMGLKHASFLEGFLEEPKSAAKKALHERLEALKFLQAYEGKDENVPSVGILPKGWSASG